MPATCNNISCVKFHAKSRGRGGNGLGEKNIGRGEGRDSSVSLPPKKLSIRLSQSLRFSVVVQDEEKKSPRILKNWFTTIRGEQRFWCWVTISVFFIEKSYDVFHENAFLKSS